MASAGKTERPIACLAVAIALSLPLLSGSGCLKPDPTPRFTPAWEPFDSGAPGWHGSRSFLVVADCQVHNLYSEALPERNLSAEAVAATAIRPPQLDLFAPDVLAWILKNGAPDADAVIHLGDALDLACEGEWDEFLAVMEGGGRPWFMAPGNHDFYYFGTYDPQDVELWKSACHGSGSHLTKDRFIRLYVSAMLRQDDAGCAGLAAALGLAERRTETPPELATDLPEEFEWQAPDDGQGLLQAICWRIDEERPWRSFIIQSIQVTDVAATGRSSRILLLDSCQFQRRPGLIPNAWQSYPLVLNCGFSGQMLPDQLRKVREWVEQGRAHGSYSLACHHPFDGLEPRTKSSLGFLWREMALAMMFSGHTHQGYFAHHDLGGDEDELELNLGSTTDWPMEWRVLSGWVNPDAQKIYIRAERHTLVDELSNRQGFFLREWEVPRDAPDDYRKYKQGHAASSLLVDFYLAHHIVPYWLPQPDIRPNAAARETEEQVKDTLLWTYFRLLQYFPTDTARGQPRWPARCGDDRAVVDKIIAMTGRKEALLDKVAFLEELAAFERTRLSKERDSAAPSDDARLRFKISQAAWASRFESARGRRLRVEDELIRVDWEAAERRDERMSGAAGKEPEPAVDK